MFSFFSKKTERRSDLGRLVDEVAEAKLQREHRREWAVEQATWVCGEGCSVEEVLRAAKRIYLETFDEEWSE